MLGGIVHVHMYGGMVWYHHTIPYQTMHTVCTYRTSSFCTRQSVRSSPVLQRCSHFAEPPATAAVRSKESIVLPIPTQRASCLDVEKEAKALERVAPSVTAKSCAITFRACKCSSVVDGIAFAGDVAR